mgnify:CR=1 FL=1|jgi:hypothetical protein
MYINRLGRVDSYMNKRGYTNNMKEWNFTFDDADGGWGWNSVWARGKKSAINKANKQLKKWSKNYTLRENSLNTDSGTHDMLMRSWD